ncbi:MAG: hypothetical protein ABS46_11265 [Cytophagaceae bacterium SCN 52-12]|nr:MAG: hypothetical protein ABS46_11265 [Cytophagaceae bacterium SCN 52-12]
MAVIGWNALTDKVHLVALVDIDAGTEIKITDRGWNGDQATRAFTASLTGDGVVTWTVSGAVTAGTVLELFLGGSDDPTTLTNLTASADLSADIATSGYTVTDAIINTGDQVFIYQGTDDNPFFIFGLNSSAGTVNASNWNTSIGAALRDSYLPNGTGSQNALTNGVNAIGLWGGTGQQDNAQYTGPTAAADRDTWLGRIANISNWTGSNADDITNPVTSAPTPLVNIVTSSGIIPDANGIVYVDSAVVVPGNGSSWANALKFLSDATVAAETNTDIKEIRVAKGTYYPTGLQSESNRDSSFAIIRGGLKLYGGYPNGGGTRNYTAHPTIMSGDINTAGDSLDNSYHVLVIAGIPAEADSVVVDGFTISGGYAEKNSNTSKDYNGLTTYADRGAGIVHTGVSGNTHIRNSTVTRNFAILQGGGIFNQRSNVTLTNVAITQNLGGNGGGMYNDFSSPRLSHMHISGNHAPSGGGGMYNGTQSSAVVVNSTISGNSSYNGGGIFNIQCTPEFFNVIISGNTGRDGGGMYCLSATPVFTNATFSGNLAEGAGGGAFMHGSSVRFNNSIIWGNSAYRDNDLHNASSGDHALYLYHTLIDPTYGNLQGKAVFFGDPQFVDAPDAAAAPFTGGNYRLQQGSPAINTGTNQGIPAWDSTDIAGHSRIYGLDLGGIVDLGAYESTEGGFALPDAQGILYVDNAIADPGDGSSWGNALKFLSDATRAARSNDNVKEIHVAKGTYYPTGLQSGNERERSFFVEGGGLKLYGGYPNGGGTRDYQNNPTILSGDISVQGDTADNSYHVMVLAGNPENTDSLVVDGFTFTGGNANSASLAPVFGQYGLGVYDNGGGGLMASLLTETAVIRNCTFEQNYAHAGAGIAMHDASPLLTDCLFRSNHVIDLGEEGLNIENSGGAMMNSNSSPRIERSVFQDNSAPAGGAMGNIVSSPTVLHSTFSGNHAPDMGLMMNQQSSPVFINTLFTANYTTGTAAAPGGMVVPSGFMASVLVSAPRLINCTVAGNYAAAGSGSAPVSFFVNIFQSSVTVSNSIIYGNEGMTRVTLDTLASESFFQYSLVQGMEADEAGHNLAGDTDPLFADPANSDYRLQACSPAINKGDNTLLPGGVTQDADGSPRIAHTVVDMGAFEFQAALQTGASALALHNDESTKNIDGPTDFYGNDEGCRLIARVEPTGADPVSGSVTAKVGIDPEVAFHNGSPYVQRHYLINAQEGESARVTLYFTQDEFDNFNNEMPGGYLPANPGDDKSNLRIYQFHGTTGSTPGDYQGSPLTVIAPQEEDIQWNDISQRWEVSFAVAGFSGFFIGSDASPLPVRLVSFSGSLDAENTVGLHWEVVDQQNIEAYKVEYSSNGIAFEEAGTVAAIHTPEARYAFRHTLTWGRGIAYYRLRITEADGTQSTSKIISVKLPERSLASVYPVPADRGFWLEGQGVAGTTARLVNVHGVVLKTWTSSSDKQYVDISLLPSGMYFIRLQDGTSMKVVKK